MPSPFPGMDPYLEQPDVWLDFHQSFVPLVREMLGEQVRPKYLVKIEEQLFIHELPEQERRLLGRSDVSVARPPRPQAAAAADTLAAPAYGLIPTSVDIERHAYLEIRDRQRRQLVTVIELLSPSNKNPGPDRDQYLAKRERILASTTHLVELDLLRGGPRLPVEELPPCDYYAMVSRYDERPRVGLWPTGLRDQLPMIPVPLLPPDPDARLDVQVVLNRVYDAAGYEDYVYANSPQPPLREADAAWARQLVPGMPGDARN